MARICRNPFQGKQPRMHRDPGVVLGIPWIVPSSWAGRGHTECGSHSQGSPKTRQWEKLEELRLHHSHSPGKGSGHRDWSILGTKGSPKFRLLPQGRSQHPPGNFVGILLVFQTKICKICSKPSAAPGAFQEGISEPQVFLGIREEPQTPDGVNLGVLTWSQCSSGVGVNPAHPEVQDEGNSVSLQHLWEPAALIGVNCSA